MRGLYLRAPNILHSTLPTPASAQLSLENDSKSDAREGARRDVPNPSGNISAPVSHCLFVQSQKQNIELKHEEVGFFF